MRPKAEVFLNPLPSLMKNRVPYPVLGLPGLRDTHPLPVGKQHSIGISPHWVQVLLLPLPNSVTLATSVLQFPHL